MNVQRFMLFIVLCVPMYVYGMNKLSESTRKLIYLYDPKYRIPSDDDFFKKYVQPIEAENKLEKRMQLFNIFIYEDVKRTYEKDKIDMENKVMDCRPGIKKLKGDQKERRARKDVALCKYCNIAYLFYADAHKDYEQYTSYEEYTIEDIIEAMAFHLYKHGVDPITNEAHQHVVTKYSQKVIAAWKKQSNSYVSPLECMKFEHVKNLCAKNS